MEPSRKLELFLGLGCKPMQDVVCHVPRNDGYGPLTVHVGNYIRAFAGMRLHLRKSSLGMAYIEAFPHRRTREEVFQNITSLPCFLNHKLVYNDETQRAELLL